MPLGRVDKGAAAQKIFKRFISRKGAKGISVAGIGSQVPDIRFQLDNIKYQVEIKSTSAFKEVSIFDERISRNSKETYYADTVLSSITGNKFKTFEEYINYLRKKYGNNIAGYIGDEGNIPKSGRVPREFFAFKTAIEKERFLTLIRNHWKDNKDGYFCIVHQNGKQMSVFSTTKNSKKLFEHEAPPLTADKIKAVYFDTAGGVSGSSKGKLRIAFKIILNNVDIIEI